MELGDVFGVPAHLLVVHAVVVLVPLTAVGAVAVAVSPWIRSRVGWLVAAGAVLDVLLVPLATGSGESLQERVGETRLVERHAEMGEQLLAWVLGLAVVSVAAMILARRPQRLPRSESTPWEISWLSVALVAATVLAATGALVQVVRIGHSGAEATWSDVRSPR